jgi:hypothetical protein
MKLKSIKIITANIIASILLLTPLSTYASSLDINNAQDEQILIQHGFKVETVNALNNEDKNSIATALVSNPSLVDVSTTITEVDNLTEIEKFCSLTNEQLIQTGANLSDILRERKLVETLYTMSDTELQNKFGLSKVEGKLIKRAIEKGKADINNNRLNESINNSEVTASGTISDGQLTYTMASVNQGGTTPNYKVTCSYSWSYPYLLGLYTDQIAIAWGGGFNTKNVSSSLRYQSVNTLSTDWTSTVTSSSYATLISENPNTSLQFGMPQTITDYTGSNSTLKTRSGSISFNLYQTIKQGFATKIVSNYLHRIIGLSASVDITVSGLSVTLAPVGSWDTSAQVQNTVIN